MISQTFLILGVILITIGITRQYFTKDNSKVIYRYIPRTFKEDQSNPVPLSDLFGSMFEGIEPSSGTFFDEKVLASRKLDTL
jgi:hypothetical protein